MLNQPPTDMGFDARLRTMRILWGAQLMAVIIFVIISRVLHPSPDELAASDRNNPTLLYALGAAGLAAFAASFVLKAIIHRRAAEQQRPAQMQVGLILALTLCEVSALLGLLGLFVTWNDYAYLLFALGALGMVLHFPRRAQLQAAYYKSGV